MLAVMIFWVFVMVAMVLVRVVVVDKALAFVIAWEARVVAALLGEIAAREARSPVPTVVAERVPEWEVRAAPSRSRARLSCILQAPSEHLRMRAISLNF